MLLRRVLAAGILAGSLSACGLPGGSGPTPHAAITVTADPASPVESQPFTITWTNTGDADDTAPLSISIGSSAGLPSVVPASDTCGLVPDGFGLTTTTLAQGASCSITYLGSSGGYSFGGSGGPTTTPGSLQIFVQIQL
jgi:hypothetical protein